MPPALLGLRHLRSAIHPQKEINDLEALEAGQIVERYQPDCRSRESAAAEMPSRGLRRWSGWYR